MSQSCATCPVRSRALNRRAVFGADLDSAIAMNLLAKISETRRARDLSRRVTVQRRGRYHPQWEATGAF